MKVRTAVVLLVSVLSAGMSVAQQESASAHISLMPQPASVEWTAGRLPLHSPITIAVESNPDSRLLAAVQRAAQKIERSTGLPVSIEQRVDSAALLSIECATSGAVVPSLHDDESYTLNVSARGSRLSAQSMLGILRGLETFVQLIGADPAGYFVPTASIQDHPRFAWRGLMIDCSRHFEPVDVIERNLDGMAALKLNVFHWHLTDDQGFRVESKRFPKLHQMGSDGLYYTQEQIREIVAYAAARGIRVVPEFDMPGHTTSWFVGYPELASASGPYAIERNYGIFDPTMDPTREATYRFLDKFFAEMATLFPDRYVHIGGDENNGVQWTKNPRIQSFMRQHGITNAAGLQAYFNLRLQRILEKNGKAMVGWNEPELPRGITNQTWSDTAALQKTVKDGYHSILSGPYYLDHFHTIEFLSKAEPLPAGAKLTAEETERVLGGEALMWGEFVTQENIDSRIWPYAAVIAEKLWSPLRAQDDTDDVYRRVESASLELEGLGLSHRSHREKMFRLFAHSNATGSLQVLADASEPVDLGSRESVEKDTQQTPLNRFADVIAPECSDTRFLSQRTHALLDSPSHRTADNGELIRLFQQWRELPSQMEELAASEPRLVELRERWQELAKLGQCGMEALSFLDKKQTPPAEWTRAQLALLDAADKPKALIRFPWLDSMRDLVTAASRTGAGSQSLNHF